VCKILNTFFNRPPEIAPSAFPILKASLYCHSNLTEVASFLILRSRSRSCRILHSHANLISALTQIAESIFSAGISDSYWLRALARLRDTRVPPNPAPSLGSATRLDPISFTLRHVLSNMISLWTS
jgi:hypothetical protein